MATVGYMEGIDPLVLTRLTVRGIGTLPLSNGFDNHGKFITSLARRDEVDVVVGHLHKVVRTQRQGFHPRDLLQPCLDGGMVVMIVVPQDDHILARQLLGPLCADIVLVDPARLYESIATTLGLS
jgi:hypothetical protein